MSNGVYDVIVVGAGFSGLSASYYLKQAGLHHIVFERHRIGDSWRSQRWDSFRLNSTNKLNVLPGTVCEKDEDAFDTSASLVISFNDYRRIHHLPVIEEARVISVEKPGELFYVTVSINGEQKFYSGKQVLIASGAMNQIKIPDLAEEIPANIRQLHASQYRNSERLPEGAILVVGSAQSGIQIAFDLIASGREVYLSTSEVGRLPRWYRGRDIFYWLIDLKFFDITADSLNETNNVDLKPQQITGAGSGRDTISLQAFAKKGGKVLGKLADVDDTKLFFESNAKDHVRFADKFSADIKARIDEYIIKNNIDAPPPHFDQADIPDENAECANDERSIDIKEKNINTIIWATGFHADYNYIKLPVFDKERKLIHDKGVTQIGGLHFLGYPWMLSKRSTILYGIAEDVKVIMQNIFNYAEQKQDEKNIV